jgi:hypothetical protein
VDGIFEEIITSEARTSTTASSDSVLVGGSTGLP